jgi:hypothetical protein
MCHISFDFGRLNHAIDKGLKAKAAPNQTKSEMLVHRVKFRASSQHAVIANSLVGSLRKFCTFIRTKLTGDMLVALNAATGHTAIR